MLAAGESRRLGRAKQLVRVEGRTLLERTIDAAVSAGASPVIVVLGAMADEIRSELPSYSGSVRFVVNKLWNEGMGGSIACGVKSLLEADPYVAASLLLVCDQPALDAKVLKPFLERSSAEPGKIHLADYGTGRGPPVIFPREFFDDLLALRGDSGARDVHRNHPDAVRTIPFPGGAIDIDTPADLGRCDT